MENDLDVLLQDNLLQPPSDFTERVMQRVQQLPQRALLSATSAKTRSLFWNLLRLIATIAGLIGGGILGLSQIAGFVFAFWITATAI
jgi:hypothetical protein